MFASWSRSWNFAKLSFSTLRHHQHLITFPAISGIASLLVLISFMLPLSLTGQLDTWLSSIQTQSSAPEDPRLYITAFLFYFCNYFTIVFFNTALIASVMNIFEGKQGSLGFGLKFATRRIHAIFAWALVSACVGMILNAIERNQKAGRLIASLIGSAWTALTYFVIPVIASKGLGPVAAIKTSMDVLKKEWGTALVGNFSMGMIGFILFIPIFLLGVFIGTTVSIPLSLAICGPLALLVALITSTVDAIFKAHLYSFATGKTLPSGVETDSMRDAFSHR